MSRPSLPAVLILAAAAAASAEVVEFFQCPYYSADDAAVSRNCSVHSVKIHPCAEAASREPCKIRKGQAAGISFSYTPDVSVDRVKALAFWHSHIGDVAFQGMDIEACRFTSCPLRAGTPADYSYDLQISRKFPSREFSVMWKLWSEDEQEMNVKCCFIVRIKILGQGTN